MAATRSDLEAKCSLPLEVGLCSSRQSRWFFNTTSSHCEAFNYTGCRGNDNRFETRSACKQTCEPHRCEPVRCKMFCPFGWVKDVNGCDICQCVNPCKVKPTVCLVYCHVWYLFLLCCIFTNYFPQSI